jgi:hypothetical protein
VGSIYFTEINFRRNNQVQTSKVKKYIVDCGLLGCDVILWGVTNAEDYPEDGGNMFLQNWIQDYMTSQHRRPQSTFLML